MVTPTTTKATTRATTKQTTKQATKATTKQTTKSATKQTTRTTTKATTKPITTTKVVPTTRTTTPITTTKHYEQNYIEQTSDDNDEQYEAVEEKENIFVKYYIYIADYVKNSKYAQDNEKTIMFGIVVVTTIVSVLLASRIGKRRR